MSQRDHSIDVMRGTLLVLMTMTHLPTVWSGVFGEPLGFISAAEGFVFLSAFMAGKVFTQYQLDVGIHHASRWIRQRALRLYAIHMILLLIAFTAIAWVASHYQRPALQNLLDFYFQAPRKAMLTGAMLIYQPPLQDILPMYILFCVGTSYVMNAAHRWGWSRVICVSAAVWLAAQFGLRRAIYSFVFENAGWNIPYGALGSFDLYAWQFLWVLGLWFGALGFGKTREVLASSRGMLNTALAVSCAIFIWRHYSGPMGFQSLAMHLLWIDKWSLSAVRLVNLVALVFLIVGFGAQIKGHVRVPWLATLGRASLWVFAAHIVSVLVVLALIDTDAAPLGGWRGVFFVGFAYAILTFTALIYRARRKRPGTSLPASTTIA